MTSENIFHVNEKKEEYEDNFIEIFLKNIGIMSMQRHVRNGTLTNCRDDKWSVKWDIVDSNYPSIDCFILPGDNWRLKFFPLIFRNFLHFSLGQKCSADKSMASYNVLTIYPYN